MRTRGAFLVYERHMTYNAPALQGLVNRHRDLARRVGNTPLVSLPSLTAGLGPDVRILAKQEWRQIGGSVKARAAHAIIGDALLQGHVESKRLLDASSGNTGIAYGAICAALDLPLTLCLPSNASPERKAILRAYGVEVIETSPFDGTDGAQQRCRELIAAHPKRYHYLDQYANPANRRAHRNGTAEEIWRQTAGAVTHFVAGLGTTGTFNGTTSRLKELNPNICCIAFQPDSALHGLEGWKHLETARVPEIHDPAIADAHAVVSTEAAYAMVRRIARKEGMLISPSAAANLCAALRVAEDLQSGTVVTVLADDASKYGDVLAHLFPQNA